MAGSAAVWMMVVGLGLRVLLDYENKPGAAGAAPLDWPKTSPLLRDGHSPTLLMLIHPRCPCTRASLEELAHLMARVQGKVIAYAIFLRPEGVPDGWERTDLWRSAAAIPGVTVFCDQAGMEARRFHVETSGDTLVYDARGHLQFSGGITASRGHAGDNAAESSIVTMLSGGRLDCSSSPVFGCALFDSKAPTAAMLCSKN